MTLNSSDQLFESLSAMVDNEASELEMRRVLKNMENNPEVLERWRRYHLIGSVMRKELSGNLTNPGTLVSSISNTLNHENVEASTNGAVRGTSNKALRDMVGKTAIAASFAATLVLGFNYLGTSRNGELQNSAGAFAGTSAPVQATPAPAQFQTVAHAPVGFELPMPEARTVSLASGGVPASTAEPRAMSAIYMDDITDYETQEMLNRLLIQHAERASAHGSLGIMPFARVHKMQVDFSAK
jgi:sigma-E factor negative regulatory protein RseA